jgi:predicted  nucleic acid-binding Zn-ribbon protein
MSRASGLYRLQEIDSALDRAQQRIESIDRILQASELIQSRQAALAKAEAEWRAAESASRSAEDAASLQRAKIEQTDKDLYSGAIKNPKELQDLQQESESLKRHLSTLEDRLLEAMVAAEEAEIQRDEAREFLTAAEETVAEEHAQLHQERAGLVADLSRLQAEREACLASVDQSDVALYLELRQGMGSVVVARVQDGSCGVCGVILPASASQAIRSADELVRCSQCHRILYAG